MNIYTFPAIFLVTGLYLLAHRFSLKFRLSGTAYYGLHVVIGLGAGALFVWLVGLPILSSWGLISISLSGWMGLQGAWVMRRSIK